MGRLSVLRRLLGDVRQRLFVRPKRPYKLIRAGRVTTLCIGQRADLQAAQALLGRAVAFYCREEGYIVFAREPLRIQLSKYVVDLDFFAEMTLSVEFEDQRTDLFSLN
jgi:hypothetical protein